MMQSDLFVTDTSGRAPTVPHKPVGDNPVRRASTDGRGKRDTSRDGFIEHLGSGRLSNNQTKIMRWLAYRAPTTFTRAEIARGTGIPLAGCCGRVNELLHNKLLLKEHPRRACSVSGKPAHPVGLR
jgi:hypothetical protein